MLKLRKASIVILAQAHNPSIISPDWVQKVLLIKESPSNFVHTPPFSLFDSASFRLTIDTERLELVPKALDEKHILICGQAASTYLRKLPHIPYRTVGLNYIWEYSPESLKKPMPQLKLLIDDFGLNSLFKGRRITYDGNIRVDLNPYKLTIRMNYEDEQTIVFNYNFSYAIQTARKAANILKAFPSLKDRSHEITKSILARGEENNG
jgi:hypothetical protein